MQDPPFRSQLFTQKALQTQTKQPQPCRNGTNTNASDRKTNPPHPIPSRASTPSIPHLRRTAPPKSPNPKPGLESRSGLTLLRNHTPPTQGNLPGRPASPTPPEQTGLSAMHQYPAPSLEKKRSHQAIPLRLFIMFLKSDIILKNNAQHLTEETREDYLHQLNEYMITKYLIFPAGHRYIEEEVSLTQKRILYNELNR